MQISIVAVGKIKEKPLRATIEDYFGRIQRYTKFREVELKDGGEREVAARFAKAIDPRGVTVALEVEGKALSSPEFARFIEQKQIHAVPSVHFLIGGSYGLPASLRKGADMQLSLGRMTLPHRLARLILAEQIYRAFTILNGEPYSH